MPIVGSAEIVIRAVTTGFQAQVTAALASVNAQAAGQNMGRQVTRGFSSGASGLSGALSSISGEALAANDAFRQMVTTGYFVGPALASVASGIGAVVGGLFALGAQLGAATPALVAFGGVLAALAQGFAAIKLGFGGVGKAISSILKGSKGASDAQARADRITDAQERLARVIESNAERRVRADRDVEDAQLRLNKVREEAIEQLQQLNFQSEDAVISEKKAAIELEKARETLARVQDLPPNSRARREAELAFAEAELNLRKAKDRTQDLSKEAAKQNSAYAEKGASGLEQVANAERALQDAVDERARSVRDADRAQADAEKALERAKRKDTGGGGGDDPFKDLSPAAIEFAKFIADLKPKFIELRNAVAEELLPRIKDAITILVEDPSLFPLLKTKLSETGQAAGEAAKDLARIITSAPNLKNLGTVMDTNNYVVGKSGKIIGNLYSMLMSLLAAADPLIRRFTDWIETLTGGWAATLETKNRTGKLTEIFDYAGDVAATLGDILGDVFGAIMNIGKAAAGPGSAGEGLLNTLRDGAANFKEWSNNKLADGTLAQYFHDIMPTFYAIGSVIKEVVIQFARLGDNKGTAGFFESLIPVVRNIGDALDGLTDSGPAFGNFLEKFTGFIKLFAESGSITNFFNALSWGLGILTNIFSNPMVAKIVAFVAAQLAFVKAAQLGGNILRFAFMAFGGYFIKIFEFGKNLFDAGKLVFGFASNVAFLETAILKISYALGIGVGPAFAILVGAVVAVIAIFVLAYKNSEKFREAISGLIDALKGAFAEAFMQVKGAFEQVMPLFSGTGEIFKEIGDFLAKYLVPILQVTLVAAIRFVGDAFSGVIKIIGSIIGIVKSVVQIIIGLFAIITGDWGKAKDMLWKGFSGLVSSMKVLFSGIKDIFFAPFKAAFNLIAGAWNNTAGKLSFTVPSWVPKFGGNGFSMPKIPLLAQGGIVPSTPGGMLAVIGEGGRSERVEPLDASGLSAGDRAVIAAIAAQRGGDINITVNPSAGMNEVELANIIGRQIAWQMRRGAA